MSLHIDLTAMLGDVAAGNFYLQAYPQEMALPCVVYRVLSREPQMNICGKTGQVRYVVLFECWAEEFAEAFANAAAVRSILDADTTLIKWEDSATGEEFEPVTEDFMQPVYYGFFYNE